MLINQKSGPILPGRTIGMLGGGQLGRMFALAAKKMGYRIHVFSPDADSPAGQVADVEVQASLDDIDAVTSFAKETDVITLESENIPRETVLAAARHAPVNPGVETLETTQDRILEKSFLRRCGVPVADFRQVANAKELQSACKDYPNAVLKTARFGYDGKGQVRMDGSLDAKTAWDNLGTERAIIEQFVDFDCEFSVVAARTAGGLFSCFPLIRNTHRHHILDVSVSPSGMGEKLAEEATSITREVMEQLKTVGVICIEFFLASSGRIFVNEIAPRPHNSGHLTIEGNLTSQFEQQVRAVCGLNLGLSRTVMPAAMVNLLGDCWQSGTPQWNAALSLPNVKLHLYGKAEARPGRKMGHLTALAATPDRAVEHAIAARTLLNLKSRAARKRSGGDALSISKSFREGGHEDLQKCAVDSSS